MVINKQSFETVGVTEEEYLRWCKENHKAKYKIETKQEFFKKIVEGRIVRDSVTKKLVKRNRKK